MEITNTRVGDYLLPDIKLSEPTPGLTKPLGRYGQMRQAFLKEHKPALYATLLLSERLFPHLRDVDAIAKERRRCGVSAEIILAEIIYE